MNYSEWLEFKKNNSVKTAKIDKEAYIFGNTLTDVFANVLQGGMKGLEGIYDIGATAVGAVGGLFDKEFKSDVKNHIKYDWASKAVDTNLAAKGSLISRMNPTGQNITRGVAQGIGQMLPAVGANFIIPGSGLVTLGASAAGTGTESAYNDGADYGEGAAYGILSGVVEMATEKLTGGFTANITGKGLLDDAIEGAIKKVGKSSLFKVAKNFAEEGFEEMLATAVEPTLRTIYQEGAYKETFSKEHTEQMLYDGLVGGLTGIVYGGTLGQIGKNTRNVSESIEDYKKIDAKKTALWEKGKLDNATELKLNAEKEATQVELKKRLSKLSDERRAQVIKEYKLDIDDKGNFRTYESEEGYNKSAYSATLHGKEKTLRYKPVSGEITDAQKQAIKLHSDLNKISRVKTDIVIADDLGTINGNKIGATFENGIMYIDSSINDETLLKRKIIHELTHSAETIGKGAYATYRDALLKAMKDNAEVKKLLDPKGDLWQSTIERYKSQLEGKTEFEQAYIVTTELVAQYSEVLFTDENVVKRLTQENRNVAQKLYNKIKNLIEYWQSRKGKSAQEKDYLAFLRKAEKLYKAALDATARRADLKTVRSIGEKLENVTNKKMDDVERMSVNYKEKYWDSDDNNNLTDEENREVDSIKSKYEKELKKLDEDSDDYEEKYNEIYSEMDEEIGKYITSLNDKLNDMLNKAEKNIDVLFNKLSDFIENYNTKVDENEKLSIRYDESKSWYFDGFKSRYIVIQSNDGEEAKIRISGHENNSDADLDVLIEEIADDVNKVFTDTIDKMYEVIAINDDDIRYSIEDFGEKIGGARKDVWMKNGLQIADLEFLNDAEAEKYVKKDYIWRPINYKKSLSEGVERGTLYLYKLTRDSIPARLYIMRSWSKEIINDRRKTYVDTINKIRNGIEKVKTATDLSKLIDEIFIQTGYIDMSDGRFSTTKLFYDNPALDVALFNNWNKTVKMFDKLDALAEREKIGLDTTEKIMANYKIKQNDDGKYYIYQQRWNGYQQVSEFGFATEEAANAILRSFIEKSNANKQKDRKERLVPPQLKKINRKGYDYRSNKNVSGDDYLSMFKFRGGEFGNWLNELDRQTSLNYGYDAFMDLADALNIDKENISLNGDLAIAFGARGQGLSGASAHYEPERRVINLTKMNGAGSLAHEWFHAVDKYIAGGDNTNLASNLSSFDKSIPEETRNALKDVISTMKYRVRLQTNDEMDMKAQRIYERAKKVVDRAFSDYFTSYFEVDKTPEQLAIYGKKRRNATAEEKKQYQELKKRVYEGDETAWVELDKLRKTVTNKQIPRGEGASTFTFDQVYYQISTLNVEKRKAAYGNEAPTIQEETTYFKNSKRIGELAQKDGGYWESPEEMLARAFATYIQDKTNGNNDYLTAHAETAIVPDVDKDGNPILIKAFPEGEERTRINEAFDKLFVAMKKDGYFKDFEGTRPIQIVSYQSNDEGRSGQTLFTQEPIAERKDLPIKEEMAAKEESDMPTPKEYFTKTTQMNLFDEDSNKNIQLSLFDDNARFAILSADDKTVYNEKEIRKAMESAIAEALNLGNNEYAELSKMAEKDMMALFETELKNSKDIDATAKKIAEFIVMNATVENAMDEDQATSEDYRTYNILKKYRSQFNLDGIKADIKHAFGNDTTAFLQWGKRKGTQGTTADVIAKELESQGIFIDAINEADIFIKFVEMYQKVAQKVNGKAKEIKKTVSQSENGFIVDLIINDLSNDIKGILNKSSREALTKEVTREKNKQIEELKKQIKELGEKISKIETEYGEETEKSNEYRMEMYHLQYKYDRLNLEVQDSKSYSDYLSKSLKIVRDDVRVLTNRLSDEIRRHNLENRLFERIDRVKNLTNYAGSGVQYADEVIALVKVLKKAKTWRGQLSSNIRGIMRTYARTIDGKALYDILAKSENVYGQAIQNIANGTGDLSNVELRVLAEIFDNFVHNVNEYDRVFFEGRKQSERELADQAIKDTESIVPFKQGSVAKMWQRFDNWLESPIWRFSRLSNYDDDGVMNRMFWEITNGLKKQEEFNMRVAEYFKPFIKKNKSIAKSWREVITINGVKMSKGQAMGLYLTSLREQAKTHIYNRTEFNVTENGIQVQRKGIIRLVDESLAETSLREAQEKGNNIEVTEEFINGLFSEFNQQEREFLRLAYDFFNKMSAEAKTETDMALYGVAGSLEKHYYPIRVADDQIYKQLGNQKPFGDLFTVFNPSFTKKTTQNANNIVVIENILDVVNRHARQMAAYYGLSQPIKSFNRVWNAKTEKGTLKQSVTKVDSGFEHYVSQLFNDMQGNNEAKEGFDKVLSKMRGWGAIASLGLNPKVWTNQSVSLFAAKGVGFKYKNLMAGLAKTIAGKTDFETLTRLSPLMYSRFRDGYNIDSGLLKEGRGLTGKVGTLQEMTLAPITWMDKMMIGSIWNAALIQYGTPEKAATMVEKAVIISQANYTPLFRPQILRSHSSALQLMTMFMSEPLQMYSQLAGAVDKLRVAHFLKKNAKTSEETAKADKLLSKAKEDGRNAFTAITVDLVMLTFITMIFDWIKGKDDDDKTFSEKFGNEMLGNVLGMFPVARDLYSLSQGFDITNMAYTGLTNIYNAGAEIFGSVKGLATGEYQSPQEIQGGIRKTIVGLSQAFGIPLRNLETYTKGITEKFAPGAVETYESWFYKKSEKAYQDIMAEALEKGNEKLADTIAELILDKKLTLTSKTVVEETKRLYLQGYDSMPKTVNDTMTYNGTEYTLSAKDFKQFVETYSGAEKDVEKLVSSYHYKRLSDDDKSEAIKLVYDYYYNIAKSELVGEEVSKIIGLAETISIDKLAIVLSKAKNLTADKDEQGKSISGSKKYKIEQAMIGLYLTTKQKNAIMDYLGYTI